MQSDSQQFLTKQVRFLGEQDGPPERLLKNQLIDIFRQSATVEKAYLARADFGEATPVGVILGLLASPLSQSKLAAEIGQVFASTFSIHVHLDILFLDRNMEERISRVCKPFFTATAM